jgi:hypothetical protein
MTCEPPESWTHREPLTLLISRFQDKKERRGAARTQMLGIQGKVKSLPRKRKPEPSAAVHRQPAQKISRSAAEYPYPLLSSQNSNVCDIAGDKLISDPIPRQSVSVPTSPCAAQAQAQTKTPRKLFLLSVSSWTVVCL